MSNPIDFTEPLASDNAKQIQNLKGLTGGQNVIGTFYGSATWDPASIAAGAEAATDITVTGVALGDIVLGASVGVDVTDLVLDAQVTAANTVTAVLANNTGGAVDLASSTVRVLVADVT